MYTSLNVIFVAFEFNKNYYVFLLNKNMKERYFLPLLQVACFMVLLQSCDGSSNLPIRLEEELSTMTTMEQEEEQRLLGLAQLTFVALVTLLL
jgi:hypothetical protein